MRHFNIIFAIALVVGLATSCEKSEERIINTTSATVEFEKSSLKIKENDSFITFPINVSEGERNGDILIDVSMVDNNAEFELDKNIIITTQRLRIPAEWSTINFEVVFQVETREMNRGRNLTFEISNVRGATVGANSQCVVGIVENLPIEGNYTIKGINPYDDAEAKGRCRIFSNSESYTDLWIDLTLGTPVKMEVTELIAEKEYEVVIPAFSNIGSYQGFQVFLSWAKSNTEENIIEYDKDQNKPLKGKLVRTVGAEKDDVVITFENPGTEGFGLIGKSTDGSFSWFYDIWVGNITVTKDN